MKTETTTWSEFLKVRKATAEEKYLHQKKKNPKEQDFESHGEGSKWELGHLKLQQNSPICQSQQNRLASSYDWHSSLKRETH